MANIEWYTTPARSGLFELQVLTMEDNSPDILVIYFVLKTLVQDNINAFLPKSTFYNEAPPAVEFTYVLINLETDLFQFMGVSKYFIHSFCNANYANTNLKHLLVLFYKCFIIFYVPQQICYP